MGALNAITHEVITVTNETYINAESVCELLRKLADLGLNIPITLVLDNAKYQKCKLVQESASSLGYRVTLSAVLFAKLKSDREAVGVGQKAMLVFKVLPKFFTVQGSHL